MTKDQVQAVLERVSPPPADRMGPRSGRRIEACRAGYREGCEGSL